MIRLIALDMDGTLLNPQMVISEKNRQAIINAQANNVDVVIATGRGFREAITPVTEAKLHLSYICLNGAEVRDIHGNMVSSTYLPGKQVPKITEILKNEKIDHQIFVGNHVYTKNVEEIVNLYIQMMSGDGQIPPIEVIRSEVNQYVEDGYIQEIKTFDNLLDCYGNKVYKVFGSSLCKKSLDRAVHALTKLQNISVSSSAPGNLEITSINAQKGIALEQYATRKGVSMDQVMVIGDSYNDLSMMKRAKLSVAMRNAPEEIKKSCTKVTETNKNDGVALAIEDILQQQFIS